MRPAALVAALAAISACALASPAARADEAAPAPLPTTGAAPSKDGEGHEAESRAARAKIARAELDSVIGSMRATSRRVRELLRSTRLRGTKAQIACVDEALSRSDVALRTAREAAEVAAAAHARGDLDAARDAERRVAELREAARLAARDGARCAVDAPKVVAQPGVTTVKVSWGPTAPLAR